MEQVEAEFRRVGIHKSPHNVDAFANAIDDR